MDRRRFLELTLASAAAASAGALIGSVRRATAGPRRHPDAEHAGKPDPELRRREEAKNVLRGPAYQPPERPLELPVWTHGRSSTAPDSMLMFRGNPAHTFYGTGPLPDRPRLVWSYRMEDFQTELRGAPVSWQGTGWTGTAVKYGAYVFVGSVGRNLYAFEAATGKVAWRYRAGAMFKSSVCCYDNRLYVGNVDDQLRCFDAATGKVLWKHPTGADLDSSPCVADGRLYIAGENGHARCLDPTDGKLLWKTFLGGTGKGTLPGSNGAETSPAVDAGDYFAATYDGALFCLDAATGRIKWKARTGDDTDASPVVSGDLVFVGAEEGASRIYAFARADGREVWRYEDGRNGYWSTPAVVGDRLWVGCQDHDLHCLDAQTGKPVWRFRTGAPVWSSPAVVDDRVVFGSYDGNLYCVDAKTGREVWRHPAGGRILSSPCIVGGNIWVGTATGTFFCVGA